MVKAQSDERDAQEQQNDRPRTHRGVVRRRAVGRETLVKPPRKPHQTAWGNQFRKIVERTLPADVFSLGRRRKLRHLDPVGRDVVRSTAEGNNGKDNNTDREEQRKLKRKGRCAEQNTAQHLAPDAPELLRPVQLQEQLHRNLIVQGHMIRDVQNAI